MSRGSATLNLVKSGRIVIVVFIFVVVVIVVVAAAFVDFEALKLFSFSA